MRKTPNGSEGARAVGQRAGGIPREYKRDQRFRQLLDLARSGDEDAIGDLFREFNFDFTKEGGRYDLD